MSTQKILKLAQKFEIKYAAPIIPIDPKYQKYINYFLQRGNVGYQISVDGKWGPETTKALNEVTKLLHNRYQFKTIQDLQELENLYNVIYSRDQQDATWEAFAPTSQALRKIKAKADQLLQFSVALKQFYGLKIIHSVPGSAHGTEGALFIGSYDSKKEYNSLISYFKPEIDELDNELKQNNIVMFWTTLYEAAPQKTT